MNRSQYVALINRQDEVGMHAIGRALVHLFNRQTDDEKVDADTKHHNARGFTPADARRGVITAKYYLKHRKLLDWQIEWALTPNRNGVQRLAKYHSQIAEEAEKKAAKAAAAATALRQYVEQRNRYQTPMDVDNLSADDANRLFREIDGDLSPENLHCDGEITAAQAREREKFFYQVLTDLKGLGFSIPSNTYNIDWRR